MPNIWAAQAITESQRLDFGSFALSSNVASSTLSVPSDGGPVVPTGNIHIIQPGNRGIYQLTGFPPNTALTITVVPTAISTVVNPLLNESFTVISIDSAPFVMSNGVGSVTIYVGATLSSSGNGNTYIDSAYNATFDITATCGIC